MEKQVLVNESSLVNIADELRSRFGETHTEYETVINYNDFKKISKTPNATSLTTYSGAYANNLSVYDTVTIEGAVSMKVKMGYQTEAIKYDYVQVCAGDQEAFDNSATQYGAQSLLQVDLLFEGTDTVTFYFKSDQSNGSYLGYYAEIEGLDENGNIVKDYDKPIETQVPIEVRNTYKPNEMATAISEIGGELGWVAITGTKVTGYTQVYDLSPYVKDILAPTWILFLVGTYESSNTSNLDPRNTYTISPLIYKSNSNYNYIATNAKHYTFSMTDGFQNLHGYSNNSVLGMEPSKPTVTLNETDKTVTTVGDSTHLLSLKGVLIYLNNGKKEE